MLTSFIRTITGTKFQMNQLTVTLFSGPDKKSPLPPHSWQNLKMPKVIGFKLNSRIKLNIKHKINCKLSPQ